MIVVQRAFACSISSRPEAATDGLRYDEPLPFSYDLFKARAREMRDDFIRALALVLADTSNQPPGDPNAHLAAGLIVSTWTVAFIEAQKILDRTRDAGEAKRCFLAVIDRGTAGAAAALAKTAYA